MQFTYLALLLTVTLAPSLGQKLTPNAVTSLLQGILSPKNTGQVMQMLSAAANKKRALPNVSGTVNRRFAIADNVPKIVVRNKAERMTQLVQRPQEICTKKNRVIQNSNNVIVQNGNRMALPKNMVVQRRAEAVLPKNVMLQNVGEPTLTRNIIVRQNKMPKRVIVQNNDYALRVPQMRTSEVVQQKVLITPQNMRPAEVQQKVLISQPQLTEYVTVPQQEVLIRNDNPFLPVVSPVSALTAFSSSSIPPAMPRSRGQFLRKIPIPPPTL